MPRIRHLRWWVVSLIFLASVLNYVDRQALSILAPTIQKELGLSNEDYASVLNAFLVAYTVALILSGKIVDRFGVRLSLALFVGWWSIANILTGFARSAASLGVCRFLLGLGEAGNFPAAIKTVAEWFPKKERALATGIFNSGTNIGALLTPILVPWITLHWGWEWAFLITGLVGLLWIVWWWIEYRAPESHPRLVPAELAHIRADPPDTITPVKWSSLLPQDRKSVV